MDFLQHFMEFILKHPELKSSSALFSFLKIKDSKLFEARKKDILSYKTKQTSFRDNYSTKGKKLFEGNDGLKINDFKSLGNGVESVIDMDYKQMAAGIGDLVNNCQPHYANIKFLSKQL